MADRVPVKVKSGHLHQFEAGDTINSTYLARTTMPPVILRAGNSRWSEGGTEADLGSDRRDRAISAADLRRCGGHGRYDCGESPPHGH